MAAETESDRLRRQTLRDDDVPTQSLAGEFDETTNFVNADEEGPVAAEKTVEDEQQAHPARTDLVDRKSWPLVRRFLSDWVWPRRVSITIVLLVTALLAGVSGGYPLIIKFSFDSLLGGDLNALPFVLAGVITITALRGTFLYFQTVLSNQFVIRLTTDLQRAAFSALLKLDFARLTAEGPGQHISRITNETGFIGTAAHAGINTAVRDTLSIAVLVGTMFYLDWVMSTVVLLVYPVAFFPILRISERLRRVAKDTQAELGETLSLLGEMFSAVRLVKAYRLEEYAIDETNERFENVYGLRLKAVRSKAKVAPMLETLGGLAVAGVIALAYWRISSGQSTVGDFMGFTSALLMAAQPIRALGNLVPRLQEGVAALEKFYAIADTKPAIDDKPDAPPIKVTKGAISFDAVTFQYAMADTSLAEEIALREISLEIPGGHTVAFVGRSGAGKSTLINLVPRLFDVTHGAIRIDGHDIRDVTLASLRDQIAIVSQDISLFDDTIKANIALGRLSASTSEIVSAAKAAAADSFIVDQPDGYETRVGPAGARLSGGQRQRIALARAILKDAPILLLDEATSALDAESERLVQAALAKFTAGRTTLVIAHRLSTVQNADLICVLDQSRLIEVGTHDELRKRGGVYAELCQAQLIKSDVMPKEAAQ